MPITPTSFLRALLPALGLSAASLAAAVILQGAILFPRQLWTLCEPPKIGILRVMPFSESGWAAVAVVRNTRRAGGLYRRVCIQNFASGNARVDRLPFAFALWNAASSRSGDRLFVSTPEGDIYSLDLRSPQSSPQLLGTHPAGSVDLHCATDGSIAFATNQTVSSGWHFDQLNPSWQRTDIFVTSACFHPASPRLFCGLQTGQALELDPHSGATLREFRAHWTIPIALDVSADGKRIAALGDNGTCVVTDLERNQPLWERRFPLPFVCPRFSADGTLLLTPSPIRAPCVNVVSAQTGEPVKELTGAIAEIAGIAVTSSGLVYAWDAAGAISVWDLSSGALLHQYLLECLPETTASSTASS
jgi:hypothetical protein